MEKENNLAQGQRDYGLQGDILIAVRQMIEQGKMETMESVANVINHLTEKVDCQTSGQYEPSKLDKIGQYLHMLYEAQKVEHNVHTEIDEALKQFKAEAGI